MVYRSWRHTEIPGWDLDYFSSKEWLDVQDKLDDLERRKVLYNPSRSDLFRALSLVRLDACNVAIIGQDPYPEPKYASGVCFSMPRRSPEEVHDQDSLSGRERSGENQASVRNGSPVFPMSLRTIFRELVSDLGCDYPDHGCLEDWCKEGVLLWNSTPTCVAGEPGTHVNWTEWPPLTQEIIERLSAKGKIIFVLVGNKARKYDRFIDQYNNKTIYVSHPSPRGQIGAKSKFRGSRLFSTINACLIDYCKEPIDWSL